MPRRYTDLRIIGYNDTGKLQEAIADFIGEAQDKGHYAEIQYAVNNGIATALCMEYVEDK